jgi:hypothetical protein
MDDIDAVAGLEATAVVGGTRDEVAVAGDGEGSGRGELLEQGR